MKVHNVRSPQQWEIISRHVDFQGKKVLDLGCGGGDILCRAFEAGAIVAGVDQDKTNFKKDVHPEIMRLEDDIETLGIYPHVDIIICFSVLPYLKRPDQMLNLLNFRSDFALIECQYAGDGPGFPFLLGNDEMQSWLLEVGQFEKVRTIGHTLVEGRDKKRFIWMCE